MVVAASVAVAGVVGVAAVAAVAAVAITVVLWSRRCCFRRVVLASMIVAVMGMVVVHQSVSECGSAMCSSMSASTPETC